MYDYKKDDGQLSKKNETGTFTGGNISSDFKVQTESLPQWAVDWARNRFNMDAKSVKFYVMDRQEVDDSVALASGNNVFVTSDQRNDETVIKHELTHIYQQAIGTATESNASDTSLEDEAVQVSKEDNISLAKNQTLSDRYILPREKTNVVQAFGSVGIVVLAGLVGLAGAIITGLAFGVPWNKLRFCRRVRKKDKTISRETAGIVYDIFSWAICESNTIDDFVELCKVVEKEKINVQVLNRCAYDYKTISTGKESENNSKFDIKTFAEALKEGFAGLIYDEQNKFGHLGLLTTDKVTPSRHYTAKYSENGTERTVHYGMHLPSAKDESGNILIRGSMPKSETELDIDVMQGKKKLDGTKISNGSGDVFKNFYNEYCKVIKTVKPVKDGRDAARVYNVYMNFYAITKGFKNRKIEDIDNDMKYLFGKSLRELDLSIMENGDCRYKNYIKLYNYTDGFKDTTIEEMDEKIKSVCASIKDRNMNIQLEQYIAFNKLNFSAPKLKKCSRSEEKIIRKAFRPPVGTTINTDSFIPVEFFAKITNNFTIKHATQVIRDLRHAIPQGSHDKFVEKVYEKGAKISSSHNDKYRYTKRDYEAIIEKFGD